MIPEKKYQQTETFGILGFILLIPSAISWILFIIYLSKLTIVFKLLYEMVPWLMMVFFTINPLASIIFGALSRNSESRNVYANISFFGGFVLMGFLLIAILLH